MSWILSLFRHAWVRRLGLSVVLIAWFVAFQPWGGFADPDAFYHSTMAAIMLKQGLIHEFAWLDLTSFAQPFVNQHVLFHAALMPFVAVFGALPGGQIAAVVFALVFCAVFAWCLKVLKSPAPLFWTLVLATLPAMTARLSYGKASPLAVSLFMLGVTAVMAGLPLLAFIVSTLFVLTHAGWPLLLLTQGALIVGHALALWSIESVPVVKIVKDKTWLKGWLVFAASLAGTVLGITVHPYRAQLWGFLKVQLFQVSIATPYDRVVMGNEWYGPAPIVLAGWLLPFVVALGVFTLGMLVARRSPNIMAMRYVVMISVPVVFIFALTLKSARFIEYLAPLIATLIAQLFHQVDLQKTWKDTLDGMGVKRLGAVIGIVGTVLLVQRGVSLHESYVFRKSFDYYAGAMAAIRQEVKPGERLFHSDWSHMPLLWAQNQDIRYVAGLDPTFLLAQNPGLSDRYNDLTYGKATSTAYDVIVNEMHSSAVFVDRSRAKAFEEALKIDARFERVYEDEISAVYRIKKL